VIIISECPKIQTQSAYATKMYMRFFISPKNIYIKNHMLLREFIVKQLRQLNEEINDKGYDELFIELAWLKYYGEGTPEEIANIPELEELLKSTPKPKVIPMSEDERTEWGGVELGEFVSAKDLPKIYEKMGHYADDSTGKFRGEYELMYVPTIESFTKYRLADDYEDLEHFDRVNEYMDIIRSGEELPPIIYTDRSFRDGAHRMAAHVELGRKKILAFYGRG